MRFAIRLYKQWKINLADAKKGSVFVMILFFHTKTYFLKTKFSEIFGINF